MVDLHASTPQQDVQAAIAKAPALLGQFHQLGLLQRGVHRLFEEQVERTPTAPALAFGEERLDYAELNRRANRLAHALIERGVGADRLVGVAMERSIEMVVALMAILKAGGAYVPVDPEYPEERQAYMLEDSGVELLLSQSHLKLPLAQGVQRIDLDQADAWLENHAENNPGIELNGENLAYVIYTSGSTGKPKGAGNRHSALSNRSRSGEIGQQARQLRQAQRPVVEQGRTEQRQWRLA